jgi:hypothetical protein
MNTGRGDLVQGRDMKLILLGLVAATAPAVADPSPTCRAEGISLFAIDHQSMNKQPTSLTTAYPTGAWTFVAKDGAGKPTAEKHGCLDKATLAVLAGLVADAPWTTTTKRINCKMMATTWTVDSANGKEVFQERACGKVLLDDKSAKALEKIHAILDPLGK